MSPYSSNEASGRELVRRVQLEVSLDVPLQLVVVRDNQIMLSTASERFSQSARFSHGVVDSLQPLAVTPLVRLDPRRAFGQPTIGGRALHTSSLAENFRAGSTMTELADLYDLALPEVEQALRYELTKSELEAA